MAKNGLTTYGIIIDNAVYHVEDFPFDRVDAKGPDALRKGVAYHYKTDLSDLILPYRGLTDENFGHYTSPVGIYFKEGRNDTYKMIIIRPRTDSERKCYNPNRVTDLIAATMGYEFMPDQFMESKRNMSEIGADVFMPPIHREDDFLNTIMKLAIRKKCAPFEPYGARLEAMAADAGSTSEGANIKNNGKRSLFKNFTMSPNKAVQFSDVWQTQIAVIMRDSPNAANTMLPEGQAFIIYPNSEPFEIDPKNLVDVTPYVDEAIMESDVLDDAERNKEVL